MLEQIDPYILEERSLFGILIVCSIERKRHGLLLCRARIALPLIRIIGWVEDELMLIIDIDELRSTSIPLSTVEWTTAHDDFDVT